MFIFALFMPACEKSAGIYCYGKVDIFYAINLLLIEVLYMSNQLFLRVKLIFKNAIANPFNSQLKSILLGLSLTYSRR